jgi:hypothetical protein
MKPGKTTRSQPRDGAPPDASAPAPAPAGGWPGDVRLTQIFVDAIEGGVATILLANDSWSVPADVLPVGVSEGDWVTLATRTSAAPPDDTAARRDGLSADDPGGPIKL